MRAAVAAGRLAVRRRVGTAGRRPAARRTARHVGQPAPGGQGGHPADRPPGATGDAQRPPSRPPRAGAGDGVPGPGHGGRAAPAAGRHRMASRSTRCLPCAFDHESIIGSARERLRAKLSYTNIGFALAPPTFTIAQLRDVYAAALGYPVSATNLQRILTRRDGDRADVGAVPADRRGRAAGGAVPLRVASPRGDQSVRGVPAARSARRLAAQRPSSMPATVQVRG